MYIFTVFTCTNENASCHYLKQAVREAATLCPRPKVDRQRSLARGGGVEYGVVHINYVVT